MKITDVRVRKIATQNRMKAIASVTFDDVFVVHDIKVIESDKGLFIAMPSRKIPNGEFKDIAHPINTETREEIQNAIIAKYNETTDVEETDVEA
jgi:stage V sporulation protein G